MKRIGFIDLSFAAIGLIIMIQAAYCSYYYGIDRAFPLPLTGSETQIQINTEIISVLQILLGNFIIQGIASKYSETKKDF